MLKRPNLLPVKHNNNNPDTRYWYDYTVSVSVLNDMMHISIDVWGMKASPQDAQQDTPTKSKPVLQKKVWTDWVHPMLPEGWKQQTD